MSRRAQVTLLVAVVCVVLPPLLNRAVPYVLSDLTALILGFGVCYAAAAISLNLLMGYAGQISLGHAALLGVGAFTSGLLTSRGPQLPMLAGLAAAAVTGGLVALVVGLPALRLRGLYLAIVTIGFGLAMEQSVFKWRPITRGSAGVELPRPKAGLFVFRENADYLSLALLVLIAIWALDVNVVRTKLGRAFQAIRADEAVAQSFGVDVTRYKLLAFVISGALAGVTGSLYGHMLGFVNSDTFTYQLSLALVVIVVVGGLGRRTGVVVAAFFFAALPRLLKPLQGWDQLVGAVLLIDLMARHPGGLASAIREVRERRAAKRVRGGLQGDEDDEVALPRMPRPAGLPSRGAASETANILEVRDVTVHFGGLVALNDVSLDVPRGTVTGLIGPNGAGKTTLFNAISGFVKPDAGIVRFAGREVQRLAPHRRAGLGMGRTFQLIGLAKDLSVTESFLLAQHVVAGYGVLPALAHIRSVARVEAELRDRASEAIEALGFKRYASTPVRSLSHGQQRIVELGCALVTAPDLLLLDEPSAGMSPGAAENLAERIRDIRDDLGRTVLLIEHNVPLVLDVCDVVSVLSFGTVLAHGAPADVAREPSVVSAYLGEPVAVS
jgi:ABC-type branched-subunit amino acid transport system ATPase component/ABC-type branched-subunit amino acid transport system permease subunit